MNVVDKALCNFGKKKPYEIDYMRIANLAHQGPR